MEMLWNFIGDIFIDDIGGDLGNVVSISNITLTQ